MKNEKNAQDNRKHYLLWNINIYLNKIIDRLLWKLKLKKI